MLRVLNLEAVAQPEVADAQGNLAAETSKKLIVRLLQNLVTKARACGSR